LSEPDVVTDVVQLLWDQEENYQRFRAEVQRRLKSPDEGNYIELKGDEEWAQLIDELLQEVEAQHGVKHKV
jgi:hypothetical protein